MIIAGTFIAPVALFLQFRANGLTKAANELTRLGNAIAEKSYMLQLWDDYHDRQVSWAVIGVFHDQRLTSPGVAQL